MTDKQQKEALGETYLELVSRLDEALLSFDEGLLHLHCRDSVRSFWLQGVSTQSSQSLLSVAEPMKNHVGQLTHNLLVTSMLSISTEPQSQPTEEANAATEGTKTGHSQMELKQWWEVTRMR
ncbi:hypothetical protein YC2023_027039 [Brassica napus]